MSLKSRIIIAVVAASCALNLLLSFYFTDQIRKAELQSLHNRIDEACTMMQLVNARPLYNVDQDALNVNLETFFSDENMKSIRLNENDIDIHLELQREFPTHRGMEIKRSFPLQFNNVKLGQMTVVYSTYLIEEKIVQFRNHILWITFGIIVALAVGIAFIVNKLMQPISHLSQVASEIASGNLDRNIDRHAPGEIGELARNFIAMRDAVKEKIHDLAKTNKHLERVIIQKNINEKKILRQTAQIRAVNIFFQKSMPAASYKEIARIFIPIVMDVIPSQYCFIGEVSSSDDNLLEILAISDQALKDCLMAGVDNDIKAQGQCIRGIREKVIRANQPLISNDPASHPAFVTLPERHIPIDSFLGVPMTLGTEIKGIIALAGKKGGYDPDDLAACEMLSIALVEALSLKKREEEKEKLKEMMIHSEKMVSVGGLAAGMAHEINNPLAGILQNAQVIRNRLKNTGLPANIEVADQLGLCMKDLDRYMEIREIYSMIDAVMDAGKRAADIVTNMLSFSRKSSTGFLPEQIPDLLDKTLELAQSDYNLKKRFDFKKIRQIKEYDPNLPCVMCRASEIQQVFFNILSNGAQAMMSVQRDIEPAFTLKITKDAGFVIIEIKDNGPGMTADIQKRIFEPFFTTKKIGDGTGLGLAVSYFIITENYKGTLEVHPMPEKGSTFVIRLPHL